MSSSDFMLTAEELRLKHRRHRSILALAVILVLAVVALFFGGRPTLNAIKAWQARRHAEKAFAFIAQEKWTEARGEAVAAYQLRATEPQALRAVARFLSRTRQPDALEFWKQLQDREPLTREDLRDEAAIALASGDMPRADDAVQKLISSKAEPARQPAAIDWLLAAQLSIQKGVPEDARASLEKVLNDPTATEREQYQAILFQLGTSQNQDQVNEAWSRLEKLSRGPSATALDALVLLARRALSNQPPSQGYGVPGKSEGTDQKSGGAELSTINYQLSTLLEKHPLAKAPQKLLALDVRAGLADAQREQLIARAIAEFKDTDADSLTALAAWLNSKGEYEKTIETIPLAKALQGRDLFLQRLDALGALGRWSEIKELLESERFPLDQVVQAMYLARCNAQLGEKTSAENNWKRALEAAGGDPGKLLTLADYAEKNGNLVVAQSAFETAAMESPKLRPAQQGRLRVAQASRNTKKIHDVLAEMLRLWPNDSAVQNDEGYTRLLLLGSTSRNDDARMSNDQSGKPAAGDTPLSGATPQGKAANAQLSTLNAQRSTSEEPITDNQELITIERLAQTLVQREPASMPHRTLLALARLRQNRAAEALDVYSNIQVRPNALTPSALAVHAAVLAANGRTDDARAEAEQIKPEQLVPEEQALIGDL
jgi:tetratricopeptide (TPR) repeat protein